jgi:hypothetical protein
MPHQIEVLLLQQKLIDRRYFHHREAPVAQTGVEVNGQQKLTNGIHNRNCCIKIMKQKYSNGYWAAKIISNP